jgi:hypothetical protein
MELQERFLPDFLLGKKRTCLAITEPEYVSLSTHCVPTRSNKFLQFWVGCCQYSLHGSEKRLWEILYRHRPKEMVSF